MILEILNGDLYIMCFAVGAMFGSLVSLFTDSIVAQVIVFRFLLSVEYILVAACCDKIPASVKRQKK